MAIFWRLLFGHFLADFAMQTNFINAWKRTSAWGMLAHCAVHPVCYILLTYPFLGDLWVSTSLFNLSGWFCVFILFATHYIEDEFRVFLIFKRNFPDNTVFFMWDQMIHYIVILLVIPNGIVEASKSGFFPEKWPVIGTFALIATYACTILIYFMEKDIYLKDFPDTREKYTGMAERLILFLAFLLPGGILWMLCSGIWLAVMYAIRAKKVVSLSWFNYSLGSAVTVLCGLAARRIYY